MAEWALSLGLGVASCSFATAVDNVEKVPSTQPDDEESNTGWIKVLAGLSCVIAMVIAFAFYRSRCCGKFPKPRSLSEVESERRKSEAAKKARSAASTPNSVFSTKVAPVSPDPLAAHHVHLDIAEGKGGPVSPPPSYTSEEWTEGRSPGASPPPHYADVAAPSPKGSDSAQDGNDSVENELPNGKTGKEEERVNALKEDRL